MLNYYSLPNQSDLYEGYYYCAQAKKAFSLTGFVSLLYILNFTLLPLLFRELIGKDLFPGEHAAIISRLAEGLISLTALFIPSIVAIIVCRLDLNTLFPFKRDKTHSIASLIFIGMGICMLANIATNILSVNLSFFGIRYDYPEKDGYTGVLEIILTFVRTAAIAGIVEEFAFRGLILGTLRKYGDGFAIFISSLLFALLHGNIAQIPFAFIVGLALGFITVKSNSIFPAILLHFTNNFYAVAMSVLSTYLPSHVTGLIGSALVLFFFIFGAVLLARGLKKDKGLLTLKKSEAIIPYRRLISFYFTRVTVIVFIVVMLINTATQIVIKP